jgi:ABC-type transport system involved in multi-copper enzyme maturation permease subunit
MELASKMVLLGEVSTWVTPIWMVLVGAAIVSGILAGIYYLLWLVFPKVTAIALTTAKEAISQPLFYVILGIGAFLLVVDFPYLPYNTFGEDIKMVKDNGLTLIMILAIIMALWTASVSVAEEIEGRTALTLLSKPIGRRQFILGKFLGILLPVAMIFIVLGVLFLGSISYKKVYDARESSGTTPTVTECRNEMLQIAPGLLLAFYETVVLAAISVAISTRLPMLANLIICSSIYVLGHLVPMLVNSSVGKFTIVRFMGQLIATVLPVLDHFNIQAAVATGKQIPAPYLLWTLGYCALYSTFALLLALVMFEDRDLA